MKRSLLTLVALVATISGTALAGTPSHKHMTKHMAKSAALICPVTGNSIASVKEAVGHSTYKGKTYYFCCPDCKPKFDKDPAKIVSNAAKGHYEKM